MDWGSKNEKYSTRIERYRITDTGDRYDFSYDTDVRTQSTNRYNHSNNPKNPQGFRFPSDYFASTEKFRTKRGSASWQGAAGMEYLRGQIPNWIEDHVGTAGPCLDGLSMGLDPNLEARAITECLNKAGDAKTAVIQNLVTAAQTANLLGETVANLSQLLVAVRKMNGRRARNAFLDASGNLLLIYKFGWEPLFKDASGALDLLMKTNMEPLFGVTRNVQDSKSRSATEGDYSWDSGYDVRCKCRLWAKVDNTWSRGVAQAGAGVGSIPSVIWDVIPWSFAVDWVLPIGGVLQALTATAGLSFIAGYTSTKVNAHADVKWRPSYANVESDFGGYFEGTWYKRRTFSSFPLPQFYVKSPFTVTHALESLALLRQLRHKI